MKSLTFALLAILSLSACGGMRSPNIVYQNDDRLFLPALDTFPVCRSYGCKIVDQSSLSSSQQKDIARLFTHVKSSDQERQAIAKAIGTIETMVGTDIGTHVDIAGTYKSFGNFQQDCIDESTNTTTYLILLDQMKLLRHHTVNALTSRAPILSGRLGPHRTAVIIDKETSTKYAVDSWFHDNGHPAEIVALDTWRWGWHPE